MPDQTARADLEGGLVEIRTTFSSPAAAAACVAAILAGHEYETPQVVVAPLEATAGYAAWVRASVVSDRAMESG